MQDNTLSPVRIFLRNKWVRVALCINFIIIIIIIAINIYNSTKTAIIAFDITPIDATISINGNTNYLTNATYQLHPGTYDIVISHDNLETKTFTVKIEPHETVAITTFLSDNSNSAFEFYKLRANYASYQKLEGIASAGNNITTDHDTAAEKFISDFKKTV